MSLYKDASLVMIPSAYKDGKLYSIRPTDGSGDFTFSRGSNLAATRVDVNGLIEKGRENLFTNSNNLPNVTLDKLTRTTGHADPFGGSNAALFTEDTNTGSHRFYIFNIPATDAVYTYSIYAKPNGRNRFQIVADGGGINAQFNIADGTLIGDSNEIVSNIQSVGDGWYRISLTYYGAGWIGGYFFNDSGSNNYTGDGTSGVYLYGAQVELGLVATDYIETGASTAQAGILEDMPRLDYSGGASCPALLLEPQRTNLIGNSEYLNAFSVKSQISVASNAAISPDGLANASKLIPDTSNSATHYIRQDVSVSSGSQYVMSFFAKKGEYNYVNTYTSAYSTGTSATWDLNAGVVVLGGSNADIEDYGNGWYRCIWKGTTNSTSLSYRIYVNEFEDRNTSFAGDGVKGAYVYGATFEAGSYPTSYIPTYGSSVTRLIDNTYTPAQDELTSYCVLVDLENLNDGGGSARFIDKTTADISTHGGIYLYSGSEIGYYSSTTSYLYNGLNVADGARHKYLLRVTNGFIEEFFDGIKQSTTGTNSNDKYNRLRITPSNQNLSIHQLVVFPTALTDSECIALTTL